MRGGLSSKQCPTAASAQRRGAPGCLPSASVQASAAEARPIDAPAARACGVLPPYRAATRPRLPKLPVGSSGRAAHAEQFPAAFRPAGAAAQCNCRPHARAGRAAMLARARIRAAGRRPLIAHSAARGGPFLPRGLAAMAEVKRRVAYYYRGELAGRLRLLGSLRRRCRRAGSFAAKGVAGRRARRPAAGATGPRPGARGFAAWPRDASVVAGVPSEVTPSRWLRARCPPARRPRRGCRKLLLRRRPPHEACPHEARAPPAALLRPLPPAGGVRETCAASVEPARLARV